MKYLFLAVLVLVGCESIGSQKYEEACKAKGSNYEWDRYEEYCRRTEASIPAKKYKTPNEMEMSDGCKVRVTASFWNHRVEEHVYFVSQPINEWSDKCSEASDKYKESSIVKARYK